MGSAKPVDDACGRAGCCDARALRHADDRARALREEVLALKAERDRALREEVLALKAERDRFAGRVVALEAQCVELGHELKATLAGKVPVSIDGRVEHATVDELVDAYVRLRKLKDAVARSAAPLVDFGAAGFEGIVGNLEGVVRALSGEPKAACPPCPGCRRPTEPVSPSGDPYCRPCMGKVVDGKLVRGGEPVAGELRRYASRRPCVTVAGQDDQGVFMVTVPEARSLAIDF